MEGRDDPSPDPPFAAEAPESARRSGAESLSNGGRLSGGELRRHVLLPSVFLMVAMLNLTLIVAGLKELIVDDLGGTNADASLFFSIEMLAYILFAPVWGLLSDRWGRRRPLVVIGFAISGLLYLSYLSVDTVGTLLMLRFVQGAASVMGWSTLMAMVLDQPDDARRGRYMGVMGAGLIFGISIGAPLGGYISRELGTRAPLEIAGFLFLALAVGSFFLSEYPRKRQQVGFGDIGLALKRRPRLLVPYLYQFADRFTVGFFVVLFPQYLASLGIDDPAVRGRYLALFLLPFALLQYFTGRLSEKVGPVLPLVVGSLVYGAVFCLVGYADLYGLWWVMAALGVLAAFMFPPAMSLTARWSDSETRGSAMGGFNLAGSLGFAVGPLAGLAVFEVAGFGPAFVASGLVEILVVLCTLPFLLRARTDGDSDAAPGPGMP